MQERSMHVQIFVDSSAQDRRTINEDCCPSDVYYFAMTGYKQLRMEKGRCWQEPPRWLYGVRSCLCPGDLEILLQWNGSHPTCIVALLLWQNVVPSSWFWESSPCRQRQRKRTEKAVYRKVGITPSLFSNKEVRLQLLHSFHWEQAFD